MDLTRSRTTHHAGRPAVQRLLAALWLILSALLVGLVLTAALTWTLQHLQG